MNGRVSVKGGDAQFLIGSGAKITAAMFFTKLRDWRVLKRQAEKWSGLDHTFFLQFVVFLCLSWAIPTPAETVQSYLNIPRAGQGNAFAAAPILDSAVSVPLIGETRLEAPAPSTSDLASKALHQIGVAVDIPAGQRGLPGLVLDSAWTKVGERHYARLTIRSGGAVSVRAGVAISAGFPGRVLSISGTGEIEAELKRRNGLSWSSTSEGDTLTLLVEIPAGYRYREGDLAIPIISHIDTDFLATGGNGFANIYRDTASCAIDLACAKSTVHQTAGASVMKIIVTKEGNTYNCSGTLLADSARSKKPYVYTAFHCIDSQAVADTVATLWNFQYPTCAAGNSGIPLGAAYLKNGAQLLHSDMDNDHAFLQLNDPPPSGALFLGWNSDALSSSASVAIISHPIGDVKKIAYGSIRTPATVSVLLDGSLRSNVSDIDITEGFVQPGSSGGGLVSCDTQGCYLRGGLMGAVESAQLCTLPLNAVASRFDVAYPWLKRWLGTPALTSLTFSGWPTTVDSNTTVPAGTVLANFSVGPSRSDGISVSSSHPDLLWLKNGYIVTGTAADDTPVTLTATMKGSAPLLTEKIIIEVRAPERVIKTAPVISAGNGVSVVLKPDGTVWVWGDNRYHAVDDTTLNASPIPLKVPHLSGIVELAANLHVLALKIDGTVWTWGNNQYGQLGNGTTSSLGTPALVRSISDVRALAAASGYSVAVKSDGTVWSWGSNELGQFGNGTSGTPISSSLAQVREVSNAKVVAARNSYTVALLKDGSVMGWGHNGSGQLGTVTNDQCAYFGSSRACSKTPVRASNIDNVVSIAVGANHVLALRSDGTVWTWGLNNGGQLGNGTVTDSATPKPLPLLAGVIAIAAGDNHSLALKSDGSVWGWGWNNKGQLGYLTTDICSASVWGNIPCSKSPAPVFGLSDVSAISGGSFHSLALKTDGSVWAWGNGNYGQLGNNSTADSKTPVRVVGPDGKGFLDLGENQAPNPITALPAAKTSTTLDCLFAWAEGTYPELLSPSGGSTGTQGNYSYRYYGTTRAYLGWSASDDHFYYLGPSSSNRLTDLGAVSAWYTKAGCR